MREQRAEGQREREGGREEEVNKVEYVQMKR